VHVIVTCIYRATAHKGHIFRFPWVPLICRFDCILVDQALCPRTIYFSAVGALFIHQMGAFPHVSAVRIFAILVNFRVVKIAKTVINDQPINSVFIEPVHALS
jgi:hypothetical protein